MYSPRAFPDRPANSPAVLSITELAELVGEDHWTVRRWCKRATHRLPSIRIRQLFRIKWSDYVAWCEKAAS